MVNQEQLKKHFDIHPCPNPIHEFEYGRLIGQWQMAQEYWSQLVGETRQDIWFSVYRLKSIEGLVGHCVVIWKFKLIFGFVA